MTGCGGKDAGDGVLNSNGFGTASCNLADAGVLTLDFLGVALRLRLALVALVLTDDPPGVMTLLCGAGASFASGTVDVLGLPSPIFLSPFKPPPELFPCLIVTGGGFLVSLDSNE
jgi:hypothetical protein